MGKRLGKPIIAVLLALVFLAWAGPADAQSPLCKMRDQILQILILQYKELPIGRGLAANGNMLEIIVNAEDASTWTVIITQPSGFACVYATGESWQAIVPEKPKGPPS